MKEAVEKEQSKKGKQIKDSMRGRQRVNRCYARLLEARSGRGQKTTSRSCFHRKCLPSSWVRADAVSLPHLSSPLPVPLRVLVPGWCFLVAAAAVSMCDGPQGVRGRGAPCPPSASPLGCGTSACLFAGLRVPVFPSLVAGLVSWPLSRALPHATPRTRCGVRFSLPLRVLRPWFRNG